MNLNTSQPITITFTPQELRIVNSAMSIYYSTRFEYDPHKDEALTLKSKLLNLTPDNIKPYIEYE